MYPNVNDKEIIAILTLQHFKGLSRFLVDILRQILARVVLEVVLTKQCPFSIVFKFPNIITGKSTFFKTEISVLYSVGALDRKKKTNTSFTNPFRKGPKHQSAEPVDG